MNWSNDRVAIQLRNPLVWYSRKSRELSFQIRIRGRNRWRWYEIGFYTPREYASKGGKKFTLTLEARTWISDHGLRGNLTCKSLLRWQFKYAIGGKHAVGSGCPVLGPKDKRCTWVRGHLPMILEWEEKRRPGRIIEHSWACPPLKGAIVTQQPRRSSDS